MSEAKLTEKERGLLFYCLKQHAPNLLDKLPVLDSGTTDADLVNDMRTAVGIELMEKGFKANDEPNEYVVVRVVTPTKLSEKEKELLKEFERLRENGEK